MPLPVIERALALLPTVSFANAYGLTETSSTISVLTADDHREAIASTDAAVRRRLGSVGRPLPTIALEIRGPNGDVLPAGERGEGVRQRRTGRRRVSRPQGHRRRRLVRHQR